MDRIEALQGRRLRIELVGPDVAIDLVAEDGELSVENGCTDPADATLRGTPLQLFEALRGDGFGSFGEGGIVIGGDAEVAEQFAAALRLARPDLEEQLSYLTGDVLAHRIGTAVRDAGAWGERVISALLLNSGEYLQEESRALPTRVEVERFFRDVDDLRDSVDRVAARLESYLASIARD
jgi:ubiquinone biosynthesis protein UbiJ